MDTLNADTGQSPRRETEAERQARIAWEAGGIAKARASVTAGRVVSSARVDAWIDSPTPIALCRLPIHDPRPRRPLIR